MISFSSYHNANKQALCKMPEIAKYHLQTVTNSLENQQTLEPDLGQTVCKGFQTVKLVGHEQFDLIKKSQNCRSYEE